MRGSIKFPPGSIDAIAEREGLAIDAMDKINGSAGTVPNWCSMRRRGASPGAAELAYNGAGTTHTLGRMRVVFDFAWLLEHQR